MFGSRDTTKLNFNSKRILINSHPGQSEDCTCPCASLGLKQRASILLIWKKCHSTAFCKTYITCTKNVHFFVVLSKRENMFVVMKISQVSLKINCFNPLGTVDGYSFRDATGPVDTYSRIPTSTQVTYIHVYINTCTMHKYCIINSADMYMYT